MQFMADMAASSPWCEQSLLRGSSAPKIFTDSLQALQILTAFSTWFTEQLSNAEPRRQAVEMYASAKIG